MPSSCAVHSATWSPCLNWSCLSHYCSLVPPNPCLHPTTPHPDQDSQVLTSSDSLPDLELLESFTLPTYTNILLIISKVHTIAVKSVFSLWPQNMLTHDVYYPLEMLSPIPLPIKTFQNQLAVPCLWHIQWVPLSLPPPLVTLMSVSNSSLDKLSIKVVYSNFFHLLSSYSLDSLLSGSFFTTPGQPRSPITFPCHQTQRMFFYHLTWQFRSAGNHSLFKISWPLAFIKWLSPSSLNRPPFSLQVQHCLSSEYILEFLHMSSSYTSPAFMGSVTHKFTSPKTTCFINSRTWDPLWPTYTLRYLKWTSIS